MLSVSWSYTGGWDTSNQRAHANSLKMVLSQASPSTQIHGKSTVRHVYLPMPLESLSPSSVSVKQAQAFGEEIHTDV